ncbi:MAG: hypothetical protein LBO81_06180, partial [Clostridiales Family XIII bacterium]|nr:hypothetical protein [Clostridiales Family XIII bacterium]
RRTEFSPAVRIFRYETEGLITIDSYESTEGKRNFSDAVYIENGHYRGSIERKGIEIVPEYVSKERKIDKTEIMRDLTVEDIEALPETKTFTVRSDADVDATQDVTLTRAGITLAITGYDDDGIPDAWDATIVYRGLEDFLDVDRYLARATYEGSIAEDVQEYAVTALYRSEENAIGEPGGLGTSHFDGSDGGEAGDAGSGVRDGRTGDNVPKSANGSGNGNAGSGNKGDVPHRNESRPARTAPMNVALGVGIAALLLPTVPILRSITEKRRRGKNQGGVGGRGDVRGKDPVGRNRRYAGGGIGGRTRFAPPPRALDASRAHHKQDAEDER